MLERMVLTRIQKTVLLPIVVAVAAFAFGRFVGSASASGYCDPLGGCSFVKVSPSSVKAGSVTKIYGTTGGCRAVTLYSRAFKGAHHSFAGLPAIYVKAARGGKFSVRVRIAHSVRSGRYGVGGRCGGGHFGSATLKVHH